MTTASDFTHDEGELLFVTPFIVAGTSLTAVHVGALKAARTAISFYSILRERIFAVCCTLSNNTYPS